jgi:hypothetical protein
MDLNAPVKQGSDVVQSVLNGSREPVQLADYQRIAALEFPDKLVEQRALLCAGIRFLNYPRAGIAAQYLPFLFFKGRTVALLSLAGYTAIAVNHVSSPLSFRRLNQYQERHEQDIE